MISVWDLTFRQLGPASGDGGCDFVSDGRNLLYREHFPATIALRGTVRRGAVAFVLTNGYGRRGRWQGSTHPDHGIAYADDRREVDALLPRSTGNLTAIIPRAAFRETFEQLAGRSVEEVFPDNQLFLRFDADARDQLERSWCELLTSPGSTGDMVDPLVGALVEASSRLRDHRADDWPRVRRLFRKAVDCCEDSGRPVRSPGALAKTLGVSLRSLQLAFQACADIPPGRYLRGVRLNRAHVQFSRRGPDETTVGEVAFDTGFHELGRFSGEYRRLFGELPSETLARRPCGPGQPLPALR